MDLTFIKDEEVRKQVQSAFETAINEATTGLVAKNQELLGKLKKAQKDSAIDPAEYQAVQDELTKANEKITELTKANKIAVTEVEKHKKLYETEAGVTHKLVVQNGLTSALIEAKVKPEYMDAVIALLSPQAKLKAEGDSRVAVIGDKPLTDYVGEWVKSDKGKHYVAAPVNQGGGANGGGGEAHAEGLEKIANPAVRLTAINLAAKK
jgi:hypothetical protein